VQVVAFLCIVSFAYNEAFDALYIILLALFHDLTIVTIAYDHQTPSASPEHPTVMMLIVVAYAMGAVLAASSTVMYAYGEHFLSASFADPGYFKYKESCMFLQISHSSAILIFAARTTGFSFMSRPATELFLSAVVSQAIVNAFLLMPGNFIVEQLAISDVATIWLYDFAWLLVLDITKMAILNVQNGEIAPLELTESRAGFGALGGGKSPGSGLQDATGHLGKLLKDVSRLAKSISAIRMREKGRPVLQKGLRINPHTGMPVPSVGRPMMGPGWN